jgi:hypothetical protein
MPNSKVIIVALLLTNAFVGVMWWRSHSQAQYWQAEERILSKQYDIASKENESLQEAIVSEVVSGRKLSVLNNTTLKKCVSKHPKDAEEYCDGPETVIREYQKILNRSKNTYTSSSLLRQIADLPGLRKKKMDDACSDREDTEISTQCKLYKGSLQNK